MSEKILYCDTCGRSFVFSSGEQRFFKLHGFPKPKKCKTCKQEEKDPFNSKLLTQKLGYSKVGLRHGRNGYFNCFYHE